MGERLDEEQSHRGGERGYEDERRGSGDRDGRSREGRDGDRGGGRGPRVDDGEPKTSILVRNLPREVLASDVRDQFSKFGRVEDVYLPKDYYTGLPRGIAFVQFADPRDAADALQLDRSTVGGREVSVQYAEHGRKRPEQMAHRGGGGGGGGGGGPPGAYAGYGGGGYGGYGYAGYGGHGGYYGGGGAYGGAYDDYRGRDRRRRSRSRSRSRKRSESRGRDESDESRSRSRSRRRSRSRERSKRRD